MDRHLPKFALPALLLLLAALVACGPSSPEDKVASIRADYTIELNSWRMIEEEPVESAPVEGEGEEGDVAAEEAAVAGEGEDAAESGEEGAGGTEVEEGSQTVAVEFDLVIYFRGTESLPGVTVDITHAGTGEQEKAIFRQWVDTDGIVKGETRQAAFVIEGLEIEDGDIFAASVKPGIPENLAEYREFAQDSP